MTSQEFVRWALNHGWSHPDKHGHLHKSVPYAKISGVCHYRLKLSKISVRRELKVGRGWIRIRSGYYKNLTVNAKDQLVGMNR